MANEVHISWTTGTTLDRYLTDSSKQRYTGSAFEAYNASHWTTYASSLTEQGSSGDYFGDLPTGISAGVYTVTVRERQGGSAATTDPTIGGETYYFDGASWITLIDLDTSIAALLASGNVNVTVVSPVSSSGDITIVEGDDYLAVDNRALDWITSSAATWPTLTGATVTFTATKSTSNDATGSSGLTKSMSIIQATGAAKQVRLQLTTTNTTGLAPWAHGYDFDIKAVLTDASIVTLVRGTMTVLDSQ